MPRATTLRQNNAPPGTTWKLWRASGTKLPASLALLESVLPQECESVGVLRTRGPAAHSLQTCFPREKLHLDAPVMAAIDLAVGDWDANGQNDLRDACLLAHALEMRGWRGSLAVYGHQTASGNTFWVHADATAEGAGALGRWGGWRNEKDTANAQPILWSERAVPLPLLCRQNKIQARDLRLVVQKQPSLWRFDAASQTLQRMPCVLVYAGERLIKAYPAALGFDPIGDKQKRNDFRTPEGEFYLCEHKANSRFYRALRLSYPNAEDATRGLRQGLIDKTTHDRIRRAIRRRSAPPQNTPLGGDIMIHGGGTDGNWTWGCVALANADVKELFDFLHPGTRVTIKGITSEQSAAAEQSIIVER